MTPALIAYAVAQLADVLTTLRALRRGGVEANPVIRWLMESLGHGWIAVKLALAGGIAAWAWAAGNVAAVWIIAGITGLIALHNWWVTR